MNSTAIGPAAVASYTDDIAIGDGAGASRAGISQQSGNVALGANASAQGYRSIAIGYGAQTNTASLYNGANDIAIGQSAFAEGFNSVALGNNANVGTAGCRCNADRCGERWRGRCRASGDERRGGSCIGYEHRCSERLATVRDEHAGDGEHDEHQQCARRGDDAAR
uniref:hypothetical protein n=1 Tax=Paraburkholderia tropica TaxID=92647 RepID=UPI0038B7760B